MLSCLRLRQYGLSLQFLYSMIIMQLVEFHVLIVKL